MKTTLLIAITIIASVLGVNAFDPESASTDRFRVSYVVPKSMPSLAVLPKYWPGRERALQDEQRAKRKGASLKKIDSIRRAYLQEAYFPIRVLDVKTAIIYEVQTDRRTITAKSKNGELIWKVNPYKDAGLKAYRSEHPFIVGIWRPKTNPSNRKGDYLSVMFTGGQQGDLDLATGKYTFTGQD